MSKYTGLLLVAGCACLPATSFADTPNLSSVLEASGVTLTGYASASYSANFNDGQLLGFRAYDLDTDTFTVDQASLTIAYLPESGFGAYVNVLAGEDTDVINASYGDGDSIFSLPSAYVRYATGGFTAIAGRYTSLAGYEVTDDSANPFISRSFLFQNTQPFFHTGIRASYKFNDFVTTYLGVNNSAPTGSTIDTNKQKTAEASVVFTPTSSVLLAITDYYGLDDFGVDGTSVGTNIFDVVAQWKPTDHLTLAFNGDIFTIQTVGQTRGAAFYGLYQINDLIGVRGRIEIAEFDPDGAPSIPIQTYTGALVLSLSKHFDLLAEVRFDTSDDAIFPSGDFLKDNQGNFASKAIFKF